MVQRGDTGAGVLKPRRGLLRHQMASVVSILYDSASHNALSRSWYKPQAGASVEARRQHGHAHRLSSHLQAKARRAGLEGRARCSIDRSVDVRGDGGSMQSGICPSRRDDNCGGGTGGRYSK